MQMKNIYFFGAGHTPLFLFHNTEQKEVFSPKEKQDTIPLLLEKREKMDKDQKQRTEMELVNRALEAVERGKIGFQFTEKEESMLSTGIENEVDFPDGFESISATTLLKRSPEELRALFLDKNGVVDFHGNNKAQRHIGAGDLFDSSQKFLEINGVLGQRSIDTKFHDKKIGYVDKNGNYLQITGGEKISSVDSNIVGDQIKDFGTPTIDPHFRRVLPDGTELTGEAAYKDQFFEEVVHEEEYENLDWEERVKKSDEDALNAKVDLSRLPEGNEQLSRTIGRILAHKDEYLYIQRETNVPWMLIAAIHARESGNKFNTYLHNGEPLGKTTTLEPKGIFFGANQWKEASVDAITRIKNSQKGFSSLTPNASLGEMALFAETYNGFGYRNKGIESPYVYSGTDKYTSGKYVRDHVFDASAVDKQIGVMPIILALRGYEQM
jgi:lysozyme family protein